MSQVRFILCGCYLFIILQEAEVGTSKVTMGVKVARIIRETRACWPSKILAKYNSYQIDNLENEFRKLGEFYTFLIDLTVLWLILGLSIFPY